MIIQINDRISAWTVLSKGVTVLPGHHHTWVCQCVCGTIKEVRGNYLKTGVSKSCGCLARTFIASANIKHGDAQQGKFGAHYLYKLWSGIIQRTTNKNNKAWHNYGGRGILVNESWKEYTVFRDWILTHLGDRPACSSFDRIDNNGHYEPGNVRWATYKQQSANRRCSKLLTQ